MARPYRYVEHTADVEYIAGGATLQRAFTNSFLGLFGTLSDTKKVSKLRSKTKTVRIRESARSLEDLLWYSLQSSLSIADSRGIFPFGTKGLRVKKSKGGFSLSATLLCKPQEEGYGNFDVKGVSKYDLAIKKRPRGYSISIVVDV